MSDTNKSTDSFFGIPWCAECGGWMTHSRLHGMRCIHNPEHKGIVRGKRPEPKFPDADPYRPWKDETL